VYKGSLYDLVERLKSYFVQLWLWIWYIRGTSWEGSSHSGSLLCLKQPATDPYLEPDESSSHLPTLFSKIRFNIILPSGFFPSSFLTKVSVHAIPMSHSLTWSPWWYSVLLFNCPSHGINTSGNVHQST